MKCLQCNGYMIKKAEWATKIMAQGVLTRDFCVECDMSVGRLQDMVLTVVYDDGVARDVPPGHLLTGEKEVS